jgi:predicted acylesterase/phospholipase RssA
MSEPLAPTHPSLALSLASSHLGFHVHAGFLAALTSQGIRPGHVGAASSGAFVGGLYAAGFTPERIRDILASPGMRRAFWEWRGPLRGLAMLANLGGFTGLLTGKNVVRFLRPHLGGIRIEDCAAAELSLAVTNLTKGEPQVIRSGPLLEFIVASCAVPGLFRGYDIGGELFWDGAVCDSSPFHHFLTDERVSSVLVHVVTHKEVESGGRPSVAWAFGQAHQIIVNRLLAMSLECGKLRGRRVLVLTTEVPKFRFWKKGIAQPFFEAGYQTASAHLAEIRGLC